MNDMTLGPSQTLKDLGEFAILQRIVLPTVGTSAAVSPLGDDCAFVRLPSGSHDLVVTTDFGPRPLAWHVGHQSYRTWGWYAVMINVSDLAAGGATPLVVTTSVEAPADMLVSEFREFFEGIVEACRAHKIGNAGGNIRQAAKFACHGTAIGVAPKRSQLRRNGARPGDSLIAVGECGRFAIAFIHAKEYGFTGLSSEDQSRLCRPRARIDEIRTLHRLGLLNAASDNSDGVLGAIWNIAEASGCAVELDMSERGIPARVSED
jgi:thiamine-monophosphate kinase